MHGQNLRLVRCAAGAALAVALTSGCISGTKNLHGISARHLAATATSYNLAIEQAQNEMLLLNIIRARNHQPMYITDASKVTGTVKLDLSLGWQIPEPPNPPNATKPSYASGMPAIDYSTSPAMDVNLLNSQDFMSGFLKPTPQEVFAYYWDREWPSEFMLYLMVLKVDVYARLEGKWWLRSTIHNHPSVHDTQLKELKEFASWVSDRVAKGRPTLLSRSAKNADIGPAWPPTGTATAPTFDVLASIASTAGLSFTPWARDPDRFQLRRDKRVYTLLAAHGTGDLACLRTKGSHEARSWDVLKEDTSRLKTVGGGRSWEQLTEGTSNQIVMGSEDDDIIFALQLRSAEGVLSYLGELARLEAGAANRHQGAAVAIHVTELTPCGPAPAVMRLFVALDTKQHACRGDRVLVRSLDGEAHFIPAIEDGAPAAIEDPSGLMLIDAANLCSAGRSMMALNLAAQLIGLQKPPASPPASASTVKAAGGSKAPAKAGKSGGGGSGGGSGGGGGGGQ